MVEGNSQVLECRVNFSVVSIHNFLGIYAFPSSSEHNWNAVFVGAANECNFTTLKPLVPTIDVTW